MTDESPRRRRWWRYILTVPVLLLTAFIGQVLYIRWSADNELAQVRAETTASDPGWQLADLLTTRNAALPPPDRNAAILLKPLEKSLATVTRRSDIDSASWQKEGALPNHLPSAAEAAALKEDVAGMAEQLAVVHRAAELTCGGEPIPVPDLATYDFNKMPAPQWARVAGYAATLEAANGAAANDPAAALRGVSAGGGVARAVGECPDMIGLLVRVSVAAVAARSCERVLAWCEPADGLDAVQEQFRREAAVSLLRPALRGERASIDVTMENIASGRATNDPAAGFGEHMGGRFSTFASRPRWTTDNAAGLRVFNRLLAADSPTAARAVLCEIEGEVSKWPPGQHIMTQLRLGSLDKCLAVAQRHQATQLTAMTAVACERYRRKHGHWPAALGDLCPAFLPAVPTDPFDGKPLRLTKTPEGLVIYSIGDDGTDDGGRPLSRDDGGKWTGDVVFRLYEPAQRRKPALPPAPTTPKPKGD